MARRPAQYDGYHDARATRVTPPRPHRTQSGHSSLSPMPERSKRREICVLGFRGVGKSSITVQFVERIFVETYYPTIENTFQKDVNFRGENISLQILDTTGQDELTIFSPRHMVGIHGYLLVYDVTSRQSFRVVQYIYEKILNAFLGDTSNRYIPIVLVGNKCDLDHDRKVSVEEGRRLASEWKCSFIECSAKHDENIKAAFNQLLLQVQENEAPLPVAEPGFWSRWCSSCCCDGDGLESQDDGLEDDFGWRKDGRGSNSSTTWDGRRNKLVRENGQGSNGKAKKKRNGRGAAAGSGRGRTSGQREGGDDDRHGEGDGSGWWSRNRDHSIQTEDKEGEGAEEISWCCCCCGGSSGGRGSADLRKAALLGNRRRFSSNDVNSSCTICRLRSQQRPYLRAVVVVFSVLMVLIGVGSAVTGFQIAAREASTPNIPAHHANTSNTTSSPSPSSPTRALSDQAPGYSNVPWTPTKGANLQDAWFAYGAIGLGIYTIIVSSVGGIYGAKRKSKDLLRLFGCSAFLDFLVHVAAFVVLNVNTKFQPKDSWVANGQAFSIVMPITVSVELLAAVLSAMLSCNVSSDDIIDEDADHPYLASAYDDPINQSTGFGAAFYAEEPPGARRPARSQRGNPNMYDQDRGSAGYDAWDDQIRYY